MLPRVWLTISHMALPLGLWPPVTICAMSKYWHTCRTVPCISSGALSDRSSLGTPREKMILFMIVCLADAFHFPIREKFQHRFPRKQVDHDQNFAVVNPVELNPLSLPRKNKFLLGRRIEIKVQPPSPFRRSDAFRTCSADRFHRRIHTWPIIERMVHFCMPLMVNLRVCALNESILLIDWHGDSL